MRRSAAWVALVIFACGQAPATPLKCKPGNESSEEHCRDRGGEYRAGICSCPTSDANQPCSNSEECEGRCLADISDPSAQCSDQTSGRCAPLTPFHDCGCDIFENRNRNSVSCTDPEFRDL